jgi:hypothetical protein
MMPKTAIRTIKREKVRLELKVIRLAMKIGKFKSEPGICILAKMQFFR